MKKLKIIIIIFVLCLGILLVFFWKKNTSKNEINNNEISSNNTEQEAKSKNEIYVDPPEEDTFEYKVETVKNNSIFFTVKALTDNYIMTLMSGNKEQVRALLPESYIKEYKINDKNVLNIANIPQSENVMYKMLFINEKQLNISPNILGFIVDGKGIATSNNKKFSYNLMIVMNISDKKYSIYPENYIKEHKLNNLKIGQSVNEIDANKVETENDFEYIKPKNSSEMARQFLYEYNQLLIYDKEEAYNRLNKEYQMKRFSSIENFYKYLEDNKLLIALMSLNKYSVERNTDFDDYLCADQYDNIYIFRQNNNSIMDYEVFLDNYTIMTKEKEREYNEANTKTKAKINLNKIIAMINTKDYNSIYEHLDSTYKQNSMKDLSTLKKYIINTFYEVNKIELKDIKEENNYYVFSCKLENQRNSKESKEISITISKTDDKEFKMSFVN